LSTISDAAVDVLHVDDVDALVTHGALGPEVPHDARVPADAHGVTDPDVVVVQHIEREQAGRHDGGVQVLLLVDARDDDAGHDLLVRVQPLYGNAVSGGQHRERRAAAHDGVGQGGAVGLTFHGGVLFGLRGQRISLPWEAPRMRAGPR
jgi:hypothetical protein